MSNLVKDHIQRCVEIYGNPGDEDEGLRKARISRADYEQMRADLMMAVGMLSAMCTDTYTSPIQPIKHPF